MSHDFAKNRSPSKRPAARKRKPPVAATTNKKQPLLFFVLGVICTLIVQFMIQLLDHDNTLGETLIQTGQDVVEAAPKPNITFYKTLPKMEVNVDVEPVPDREQADYNYALQAGSFKSMDDANQLRAEIMLLGLNAVIESHTNDSGTIWHRVIVGPFTSRSELSQARNILVNNNTPTLTIKRN